MHSPDVSGEKQGDAPKARKEVAGMSKKKVVIVAAVFVVLVSFVLANLFFGWWGLGKDKPCDSPYVQGSAEVLHDHPVVLLGDILEMKVTLRFCEGTVSVHRETFEATDVSPFDLRSRSQVQERKKDGFTEWEVRYLMQPMTTVPGKNYSVSINVTYEVSRLPQFYTIVSDGVFIASLMPIDIEDIRDIDRGIKEKDSIDPRGVGAIALGGLLICAASVLMVLFVVYNRKAQKEEDLNEAYIASKVTAWWASVNSPDLLQVLSLTLDSLEVQDVREEYRKDLKSAQEAAEQAFNPDCDVEKIREELEPVIVRLAPLLMKEGSGHHGMD